jgi:enoyl-CoA hydratase/carnithine racemase
MTVKNISADVGIQVNDHVAIVEFKRPPLNFFDIPLIENLDQAFKFVENETDCHAIVLASEGKAFCAGANFSSEEGDSQSVLGEEGKRNPLLPISGLPVRKVNSAQTLSDWGFIRDLG